jgi:phage shock protein A
VSGWAAPTESDLAAALAEAVADLQFQIDTLSKKKEILKLQAPDTPEALAAVKEETAAIEAQTALLEARLAQAMAEAALVGSDG